MQNRRSHQLPADRHGSQPDGVQTDVSGCRSASISRADHHPPSLGAPANRKGEVQSVRQGRSQIMEYAQFKAHVFVKEPYVGTPLEAYYYGN